MGCNAPLVGWKSKEKTALGKRAVTFDIHQACIDLPINIRCGQCYGCQLDKSREWALRCSHEAQMHEENSFITLSYSDEHIPRTKNGTPTLRPKDFTLFMKKLRKRQPGKIKYLMVGEYGELKSRPHFHSLCFNCSFPDRTYWRTSGEYPIYRSEKLEKLWEFGNSEIGSVTFESAGYVARYQIKENTTPAGAVKEYMRMSRNPAIGKTWLDKYEKDVYPRDEVATYHGPAYKPPRYYDKLYERKNPESFARIRTTRNARLTDEMRSGARQTARERILRAKAQERKGV